jgi:ABC-type hemin transport system ATPase subunit
MLLDEPTSYLDIKHEANICYLLKRMNKDKGITIVSVFHDINLASYFSDQVNGDQGRQDSRHWAARRSDYRTDTWLCIQLVSL